MSEWAFLVDENLEPRVTEYLETEGIEAEHVTDELGAGAGDEADLIPYARENDLVVVTNDVNDFRAIPPSDHAGIVVVFDGELSAFEMATALITMTETYPGREQFTQEVLDDWL